MRYRETTRTDPLSTAQWKKIWVESGEVLETITTSGVPGSYLKSIEDTITPNFGKVCATGSLLPMNPVRIITMETERRPYMAKMRQEGTPWRWEGGLWLATDESIPSYPEPSLATISSVVNSATVEAKAFDWDALTFAAEAGKTAALLRNPLKRIGEVAKGVANKAVSIRKGVGRRRNTASILSDFASLWAEARYGWRPAWIDANDIWDAYRNHGREILRSRGDGYASEDIGLSSTKTVFVNGDVGNLVTITTRTGTIIYRGVTIFEVSAGSARSKIQALPASTLWETIPYSFIVDWFVDVGTALNAFTPRVGFTHGGSMYSLKIESDLYIESFYDGTGSWTLDTSQTARYRRTLKEYGRASHDAASFPGFNPRLNAYKITDLVALIYIQRDQVFKILRGV